MSGSAPRKRAAFESPAALVGRTRYDPGMKRPVTTVVGAALVLLRVAAGILALVDLAAHWGEATLVLDGLPVAPDVVAGSLVAVLVAGSVVLAVEIVLAVLILRGRNWPRIVVMVFAALSICGAFAGWWIDGQEITLKTSLLSLGLDILVLLALSSRSAAAYARRNERV